MSITFRPIGYHKTNIEQQVLRNTASCVCNVWSLKTEKEMYYISVQTFEERANSRAEDYMATSPFSRETRYLVGNVVFLLMI